MSVERWAIAGTIGLLALVGAVVFVALLVALVALARGTGRSYGCDRHRWSSGPTDTTPWWRMKARTAWHRLRWHRLPGQQPLHAEDGWIVAHEDYLRALNRGESRAQRRRCERGIRMAREAVARS